MALENKIRTQRASMDQLDAKKMSLGANRWRRSVQSHAFDQNKPSRLGNVSIFFSPDRYDEPPKFKRFEEAGRPIPDELMTHNRWQASPRNGLISEMNLNEVRLKDR